MKKLSRISVAEAIRMAHAALDGDKLNGEVIANSLIDTAYYELHGKELSELGAWMREAEQLMMKLDALIHAAVDMYDKILLHTNDSGIEDRFGTMLFLAVDTADELKEVLV